MSTTSAKQYLSPLLLAAALAVPTTACGAGEDAAVAAESAVVGEAKGFDLSAVEEAFDLTADVPVAGHFARPDEKLHAGPCFKKTQGSADADGWTVKRYKQGAAFFKERENDHRLCVDWDIAADDFQPASTPPRTFAFEGFGIDMVLRYKLGMARFSPDNEMEGLRIDFGNRDFSISVVVAMDACINGPNDDWKLLPGGHAIGNVGHVAGNAAFEACKKSGGTTTSCNPPATQACVKAFEQDTARERLEDASFGTTYVDLVPFAGISTVDEGNDAMLLLAHKYAKSKAVSGAVSNPTTDPVGYWVSTDDGFGAFVASGGIGEVIPMTVHYERADVRRKEVTAKGVTMDELTVVLTTIDAATAKVPVVTCTRPVDPAKDWTHGAYECKGL